MLTHLSIRKKMFLFVLGTTSLMMILLFTASWNTAKRLLIHESEQKALALLESVTGDFEGYMNEKARTAWTFAQNPTIIEWLGHNTVRLPDRETDLDFDRILDYLQGLIDSDPGLTFAFLGSELSQMYYEPLQRPLPDDYRMGTRPWFIQAKSTGKPFFMADADILTGDIYISFIQPIF